MANPRQRRKGRSGTAKTSQSKASRKNMKKVTIKGPEILGLNWDKKKTVRQNYAALGLLPTMNPRQNGGIEAASRVPTAISHATSATVEDLDAAMEAAESGSEDEDEEDAEDEEAEQAAETGADEPLKPGMARIIRDEHGNVVSILVGQADGQALEEKVHAPERTGEDSDDDDEEDEEEEEGEAAKQADESTPWGKPLKDWDAQPARETEHGSLEGVVKNARQGISFFGADMNVPAKTDVVRVLEDRAARKTKVVRHTSEFEQKWLVQLVAKYGDDVNKMARDRKINTWQKTPGELKRMIAKAGGVDALQQ
ncbi:Nop16p [Rhodotorula paludigena]|uniref:Nop16p n=1 Tax=Rhodotorula paludigena TaxID=86838 RepID=UPI00317B13C0